MLIGTLLKSLEIEDLVCLKGVTEPHYLARSFIQNSESHSSSEVVRNQSFDLNDITPSDGDDKFYEAPENLVDSADQVVQSSGNLSEYLSPRVSLPPESLLCKMPSFSRIPGLLPDDALQNWMEDVETTESLDSFVKAQIIIYDQNSPSYHDVDKGVGVFV